VAEGVRESYGTSLADAVCGRASWLRNLRSRVAYDRSRLTTYVLATNFRARQQRYRWLRRGEIKYIWAEEMCRTALSGGVKSAFNNRTSTHKDDVCGAGEGRCPRSLTRPVPPALLIRRCTWGVEGVLARPAVTAPSARPGRLPGRR